MVFASVTRVIWVAGASVAQILRGVLAAALTTPAADRLTPQPSVAAAGLVPAGSASVTNVKILRR